MLIGGLIVLALGLLLFLIFRIWLYVKAFQEHILWGLITLFVPAGDLLFVIIRFAVAWRPFFAQLAALLLAGAGAYVAFTNGADEKWFQEKFRQASGEPPPSLMDEREEVMDLEAKLATETAKVKATYATLNTSFTQLNKQDPAAVAAYNEQAKLYEAQKSELEKLRAALVEKQAALQARIDKGPEVAATPAQPVPTSMVEPRRALAPDEIVLYLRKGNPAVTMARAYLSGRRLPYREVDVDESEANKEEWNKYGTVIPTIVVDGQVVHGFVRSELDRLIPPSDELDF